MENKEEKVYMQWHVLKQIELFYNKQRAKQMPGSINPYNYCSKYGFGQSSKATKYQTIPLYKQLVVGTHENENGEVVEIKEFMLDSFGKKILTGFKTIKH